MTILLEERVPRTLDILVREWARDDHRGTVIEAWLFDPATLKINVGDSVVWVNKDKEVHDVVPDKKGDFEKIGDVKPGEKSKPVLFKKAGKFKYSCGYHEDMIGVIEVVEK